MSNLSANDVTRMRRTSEEFMQDRVTISKKRTARNASGGIPNGGVLAVSNVACDIISETRSSRDSITGGKTSSITTWIAYFPVSTDITLDDELVDQFGRKFSVTGVSDPVDDAESDSTDIEVSLVRTS